MRGEMEESAGTVFVVIPSPMHLARSASRRLSLEVKGYQCDRVYMLKRHPQYSREVPFQCA